MSRVHEQFEEQRASNESGLPYFEAFSAHRQQLSSLILQSTAGRVGVLGAGNAYDLDLDALLGRFAEVHLVDIDAAALERARGRVPEAERARLFTHGPVDASGLFHDLERWARLEVTPQELMAAPGVGAKRVAASLPGPFDVVVSSCLLTQLQLTLLQVLGEQHRLFAALRELLTLTHLRVLAALTAPGGRALLVTDLCDDTVFPAGRPRDAGDFTPLLHELVAAGRVIYTAHPEVFKITLQDDPVLSRTFQPAQLKTPWLWQNGPERRFLVYALELTRK
jgi:SAM-dependent methyltransferase